MGYVRQTKGERQREGIYKYSPPTQGDARKGRFANKVIQNRRLLGKSDFRKESYLSYYHIIVRKRKLVPGANAMRFSDQSSTAVASTLRLPAIFLGRKKLVAPLIAAPNGQCATKRRRQMRRGKKADYGLCV